VGDDRGVVRARSTESLMEPDFDPSEAGKALDELLELLERIPGAARFRKDVQRLKALIVDRRAPRIVIVGVSIRRPVPPFRRRGPRADTDASLRRCGLRWRPCRLPGRRREGDQLLFRHAAREARKDVSQVLDGVDAEQGARRADRVGDGGALGAGV